jgi:hypothetical protein
MYYIGLDVHKTTISSWVKDAAGHVHQEGKIGSSRRELDARVKTLPRPRMMAMEATIFTGWILMAGDTSGTLEFKKSSREADISVLICTQERIGLDDTPIENASARLP